MAFSINMLTSKPARNAAAVRVDATGIKEYRAAIRIQPDFADAHYKLGDIYLKQGLVQQA